MTNFRMQLETRMPRDFLVKKPVSHIMFLAVYINLENEF
jgi:hypothetical protein